ncbi:MAG: type toxin-antitoxin system VapC family toxin [Rhizobacter sp.]|nr:type toxin-antitoxin system VapC family toxin [Rhizobacter sp.]
MDTVLVDTGVWIAVCDPRDRPHQREQVRDLGEQIESMTSIVLWPVTYETLKTRFVKNRIAMERFERLLKSPRTMVIDDGPYRDAALEQAFESSLRRGRPLSLVDCVIRLVLSDARTRIPYLATFNTSDFHDVCARQRVLMLPACE